MIFTIGFISLQNFNFNLKRSNLCLICWLREKAKHAKIVLTKEVNENLYTLYLYNLMLKTFEISNYKVSQCWKYQRSAPSGYKDIGIIRLGLEVFVLYRGKIAFLCFNVSVLIVSVKFSFHPVVSNKRKNGWTDWAKICHVVSHMNPGKVYGWSERPEYKICPEQI